MDIAKIVVDNLTSAVQDKTKVAIDEFGRTSCEVVHDSFLTPENRDKVLEGVLDEMAYLSAGYVKRGLLVAKK